MRDDESTRDCEPGELGERPAADLRGRAVAQANIENALFQNGTRVEVGRYRLLSLIGSGGMGVVWGAWDPELERRVAIKLVKVASSATRAHILREGQALAKLSHPHVVPVYDVGSVDDEVYLVMELVAGATLRAWAASPRTTRAIVAVYRAAGEGLVAAHAASIVHRDFKPDNVIVGDDGRVRVLDFGLAHTEATGDGHASGTPRYMAPEQAAGAAATPAADQYSFCVALKETLDRDLPSWLVAIIARGTAPDPAARFADMAAVLAALGRDPARVWRRRAAVAGALVLAGSAFAVGTLRASGIEPCAANGDELARVWSPAIATQLGDHARTLGPYGELEAPTLADHLGRYSERWLAARSTACAAHQREELPTPVYTRTLACLERARGALEATVGAVSRATLDHFADTVLAVEALPDAEHCALAAMTDDVAAPSPAQVSVVTALGADAAKAQYLALASDPAALPLARSVAASAKALGYRPLEARAQLALGAALQADQPIPARAAYAAAGKAALSAGDDVTFVEAYARELFATTREQTDTSALVATLPFVVTLASRTHQAGAFARALLYNNAGTERLAAGDPSSALGWFVKARAEPEPDERGIELWAIPGNLAMVVPNAHDRDVMFAEERARLEHSLGAQHAFTLQERLRAALFIDDPGAATTELRDVCDAFSRYQPQRIDKIAQCNYELGWLALARGDAAEVRRTMAIVAPINVRQAPLAKLTLEFLDDVPSAARDADMFARKAAAQAAWWQRFDAIDAWIVTGLVERAHGHGPAAAAALKSALEVLDGHGFNTTATYYRRRRARVEQLVRE